MKTTKLLAILAIALTVVTALSCNKVTGSTNRSIDLSIEITDITHTDATVRIKGEGDAPAMVRLLSSVPLQQVTTAVGGALDDEEAVKNCISTYGKVIEIPYKATMSELTPEETYFVGVVAYDSDKNIYGFASTTFTTQQKPADPPAPEPETGDLGSGAGNLTENVL